MKVLLAGGGTAGHINPALAIAGYIKRNARNRISVYRRPTEWSKARSAGRI